MTTNETTRARGTVTLGDVTMTDEHDGTWTCSAGCPFVFQRDESSDDVAYHLEWHAQTAQRETLR